jgi:tripartite-type tricarboxylate transporter receptor subunit TctC
MLSTRRTIGVEVGELLMKRLGTLPTILMMVALYCPAAAQDWPVRPVRIISAFAPGGTADAMGRPVAAQLATQLGQQFVVENRGGAGGLIGSALVANAPPDGYTFGITSIATIVIAPTLSANPGFDPIRSFSHVAMAGGPPTVLVVHPSLGPRTLGEMVTFLKKSGDPLPYVSPGLSTIGNLLAESWAATENIKISHVAYKGGGQAIQDLVAGHIKFGSVSWPAALGSMHNKSIIPLAVSSTRRMPEFPEVPTLAELGHPDLSVTTWLGFAAPAGVPAAIVQRMNREINAALDAPATRKQLQSQGIEVQKMSPEEFTSFVKDQLAKWGPYAKKFGTSN